MSLHTIEIQIDEQFRSQVQREALHLAALAPLIHQQMEEACELAVVVSDDKALQALNLRYRDVDATTDVLAFPDEARGPFVGAPGQPRYLGDVVISFPRAVAQASEVGHAVEAEMQLLVIHGVLHLLGYDDVAEDQRARMWAIQTEILDALDIEIAIPV